MSKLKCQNTPDFVPVFVYSELPFLKHVPVLPSTPFFPLFCLQLPRQVDAAASVVVSAANNGRDLGNALAFVYRPAPLLLSVWPALRPFSAAPAAASLNLTFATNHTAAAACLNGTLLSCASAVGTLLTCWLPPVTGRLLGTAAVGLSSDGVTCVDSARTFTWVCGQLAFFLDCGVSTRAR